MMKRNLVKRTALVLACVLVTMSAFCGCIGGEKETGIKDAIASAAEEAQEEAEAVEEAKEEEKAAAEEKREQEEAQARADAEAEEEGSDTPDEEADPGLAQKRQELVESLGEGFEEGQVLQDFEFQDEDGNSVHVSDFLGKAVYINFFTTWCVYCGYEMEDLMSVAHSYEDDAVMILIDIQETPKEVAAYKQEHGIDLPVYYLDDWQAGDLVLEGVPISIVTDRYGVIRAENLGMAEGSWMDTAMQGAVASE